MEFTYQRKPGKSLSRLAIRLQPPAVVIVTVHPFVPNFVVEQFLQTKKAWITTQLQKIASPDRPTKPGVWLFGKLYPLHTTTNSTQPIGIHLAADQLSYNSWSDKPVTKTTLEKSLRQFLIAKAKQFLSLRTQFWGQKMGKKPVKISYKEQTSRWGSCSQHQTISLNWRLIHHPPAIIDYVVIHELAHLHEMNHSTRFWQLVEKFDSAYRVHRGWLKRRGHIWEPAWRAIMKPC